MSRSAITMLVALTSCVAAAHSQDQLVAPGAARGAAGPSAPMPSAPMPAPVPTPMPAPTESLLFDDWNDTIPHVWLRGEYLLWAIGTGKIAELGKETYNSQQFNALLTAGGKDYGDFVSHILGNDRTGMRFSTGAWFDDAETLGLEASFTYLERSPLDLNMPRTSLAPLYGVLANRNALLQQTGVWQPAGENIDRSLLGLAFLSRLGLPALDNNGRQVVIPYSATALADGRTTFEIADQELWVLDLIGRDRIYQGEHFAIDGLAGYRHIYYRDSLTVRSESAPHDPALQTVTNIAAVDQISAENGYDGGIIGMEFGAHYGGWSLTARPSVTIAYLHDEVFRGGYTGVTTSNTTRIENYGGTYLRPEDVGVVSSHDWTVIPELALKVSRTFGEHVCLSLGTSLMYLHVAARAADQLQIGLDADRVLPGTIGTRIGRDLVVPDLRSVLLNTYSLGLEIRY